MKDLRYASELAGLALTRENLYARGATERQAMGIIQPIVIETHPLNNAHLDYSVYLSNILWPGIMILLVMLFSIITGKTLFYLMLYIIMGVYMYTCVTQIFTLPQIGDYITFLLFLILYLLACISMALVLSLLVYRREDCIMLFVFLSVPLLFLSGISWPGAKMPLFWKCVSWLFPSTFGMNGYVSITAMGCSLSDISTKCIALALQSIAYFTVYALFFCRKPCR